MLIVAMVLNVPVFPVLERYVEVPYSEFIKKLDDGGIKDVSVSSDGARVQYTKKDNQQWNVTSRTGVLPGDDLAKRLENAKADHYTRQIPVYGDI